MTAEILCAMARNNAFANHRLSGAITALDAAAFTAPRTGFFPSIEKTANHLLSVDLYYLDALEEEGQGLAVFERFTPAERGPAYTARQAEADRRLIAFCDGLDEGRLSAEVVTDRGDDGMIRERIDALLLHLFQHQIHHRGQIHAMLSSTHIPPPQLDEFYLRFDRRIREPDLAALGIVEVG
ncbi:MAG TPA: DinB family protein [Methylomirabilota bacterium]|nr:DinB family protein [Methylomirabilota bacterium]